MSSSKNFLATEPVGKLLLKLSIPTIVAQLVNMLYNIVDRIYVGHIPDTGSLALTGLGVCLPLILVITAFASLVSSGGGPKASIAMGKGDYDLAERILGSCIALQILISLVLTSVLLLWNRPLLLAFGASENTISHASGYMTIYALGTIFVQLTLGMNAFITAQGFSRFAMITVLIGAVSNIILDPVFIFLFKMGVRGAALATIISQGISAGWCILFLSGKRTHLRIRMKNLKPDVPVLLPCVALGLAAFIMQSSESIIMVCFNASLLRYGGDIAVGAMTICSSAVQFLMLPLQGLAQGAQPIMSFNYGAGITERVRATFRLLLKVSLSYSFLYWVMLMAVPRVFAGIFTSDAALLDFSRNAIRIYCGVMFLMGVQMSCQMTFVSIGNAVCSIIVAMVRKFVLLLPLIYLMPQVIGKTPTAVYWAEPVSDFFAISFTAILFYTQFRKSLEKKA